MPKFVTAAVVPGLLGGLGLLMDRPASPSTPLTDPLASGYMVEVGVAFPEAAVRAALPTGFEPAPGATGGIAIYGGGEGWALSPLATGYVWVDVEGPDGMSGRFMVDGFTTKGRDGPSPIPAGLSDFGETHELAPDGRLSATAWPERGSVIDLEILLDLATCREGLSPAGGEVLVQGSDGGLGALHMPVVMDRCEATPLSAHIEAPRGHPLSGLRPERVTWAGVGTPLRWALPEL